MTQAVSLHFQDRVRVSGEVLQGLVKLHLPLAVQDGIVHVRVKLRGSICWSPSLLLSIC